MWTKYGVIYQKYKQSIVNQHFYIKIFILKFSFFNVTHQLIKPIPKIFLKMLAEKCAVCNTDSTPPYLKSVQSVTLSLHHYTNKGV